MNWKVEASDVDHEMGLLREMARMNSHEDIAVPVKLIQEINPKQLILIQGKWAHGIWDKTMVMLVDTNDNEGSWTINCKTTDAVECDAYKYERHVEDIFVIKGTLIDKANGQTLHAGGRITYPAGQVRWLETPGPIMLTVTYRDVG